MKFLSKPVWNTFDFIVVFLCQGFFLAGYWYIAVVLIIVSIPFSVYYEDKYWRLLLKENK